MLNRLMLAAFMVSALFVSAVRLPASACPVSSPPIGQACKHGSCPNKTCCADAAKNKSLPSAPLVKDDSTTLQLVAVVAPRLTTRSASVLIQESSNQSAAHCVSASTTPKRALLCTFLI